MLKKNVDKKTEKVTFTVSSEKSAVEALALMQERTEAIAEIEAKMEEEYEMSTLRNESMALYDAVRLFVLNRDKDLILPDRTFKIVKQKIRRWNPEKLAKLLPKHMFMKIVKVEYAVDAEKLDSMIRAGKIDRDEIKGAFEETPKAAYVKHSVLKADDTTGEDEADAVASALD